MRLSVNQAMTLTMGIIIRILSDSLNEKTYRTNKEALDALAYQINNLDRDQHYTDYERAAS